MKLPWLEPGENVPPSKFAWGDDDPVPGLLAAGGSLDVDSLRHAYANAAFPWFNEHQPVLWWSPDPRMTLIPSEFKVHRSFRRTLKSFRSDLNSEIRVDTSFEAVVRACAAASRRNQSGTWIGPQMIDAYCAFHKSGFAHSVETWIGNELVGGLYCVSIGRAVFGESMFSTRPDASKTALAALVCLCRENGVLLIDCQQNTGHLASLGGREMRRSQFVSHVESARSEPPVSWHFDPVYWNKLLSA